MKKWFVCGVASIFTMALLAPAALAQGGNGAPSGEHYSLNIVGVPKNKKPDMKNSDGHTIFVPLYGTTAIWLVQGDDFAVLDRNGTDSDGAKVRLPDPDVDGDGILDGNYQIWARALGKPGGYATMTTAAEVLESDLANYLSAQDIKILNNLGAFGGYLSIEQVPQEVTWRKKGKSTFSNVTEELTSIVLAIEVDYDGDGTVDDTIELRIPIFDDLLENEYWQYDNNGLKLLQVRFYFVE